VSSSELKFKMILKLDNGKWKAEIKDAADAVGRD
jgi:hypothetical protein